jgi:hypothetical protein
MSFGEPKSITESEVKVNGTILETVTSFKCLGVYNSSGRIVIDKGTSSS